MRAFLRFLRQYPIVSISMVLGAFINVGSRLNDAYSLIHAGLPPAAWEAIGAAVFFISVIVLLARWHQAHPVSPKAAGNNDRQRAHNVQAASERCIDRERSILFLDPSKRDLWRATVRFTRSGDRLRIRLDYSSHSGGLGKGFWSDRKQLLLRELKGFTKGEDVTIDLMGLDDSKPSRFWRWKVSDGGQPLVSPTMHHCRLAFIIDDRVADAFNFIVTTSNNDDDKGLGLMGENHFAFAAKWREDDGRAQ
jgi:hypothetical protein